MSGPFRSDAEQVREQLRRAEEEVRVLEEKRVDLQHALELRGRRRPWILLSLVGVVVAVAAGYEVGHLEASHQDARDLAAHHQTAYDAAEREHVDLLDCETMKRTTDLDTAQCRRDVEDRTR